MRSVLFAPGNQPDVISKLPRTDPVAAVIDLEDSTPASHKVESRKIAFEATKVITKSCPLLIRINGIDTEWFEGDVSEVLSPSLLGVLIPKLASSKDVERAVTALDGAGLTDLSIMAGVETVQGVINAVEVTQHPRIKWCYFGAEDYVADLGGVRRSDNHEVLVARSQVAQAARLSGISALDMVVTDFRDSERFKREAGEARSLGYSGKLCIHPDQVGLANEAFRPSDNEIEWANRVVSAYSIALSEGKAAIQVDGEMIDEPVFRRAKALLE
ncbi:MAG: Citrate lyase subunit beta-like protein [Acidimicrobiales bacterium AG-410-I20]|nr:MAG: Citrate lyase subunit beta-like protein [Acidimicrobiales bacterium AG-410-I20]